MRSNRFLWLVLVGLLAVGIVPAHALDMKDTAGRAIPRVADDWDSHWAAATAREIAEYRRNRSEQSYLAEFIAAAALIVGILVFLAAKLRIWEIRSTLVSLNTLGNGWFLKWAVRWGAF